MIRSFTTFSILVRQKAADHFEGYEEVNLCCNCKLNHSSWKNDYQNSNTLRLPLEAELMNEHEISSTITMILCHHNESRNATFVILQSLCSWDPSVLNKQSLNLQVKDSQWTVKRNLGSDQSLSLKLPSVQNIIMFVITLKCSTSTSSHDSKHNRYTGEFTQMTNPPPSIKLTQGRKHQTQFCRHYMLLYSKGQDTNVS